MAHDRMICSRGVPNALCEISSVGYVCLVGSYDVRLRLFGKGYGKDSLKLC